MIKKFLMVLPICLILFGSVIALVGGWIFWDTLSHGIPEIADLKTLHTTKAQYAQITASLKNTGIFIPRDSSNKDSSSYFYTIELEGKQVLVKSFRKLKYEPVSTFYVMITPYEGRHVSIYFSRVASVLNIPTAELQNQYSNRMLLHFRSNPSTYAKLLMISGAIASAIGALWKFILASRERAT